MTSSALIRTAIAAVGVALTLTGTAAAQTIDPDPIFDPPTPVVPPIVRACSQIASVTPSSARPGEDVDIRIQPPSGLSFGYTVVGVQFANGVPATFSNVGPHHVRARVPVGSVTGPVTVTCRSSILPSTWSISSATAFTPISFTNTLNPSATTLLVGNSTNVTATLSHPAPSPITLTLDPQAALSVNGQAPDTPGSVIIPAGQRSATFSVRAHAAAAAASVLVTGPNVVSSTLTINVPTPAFNLTVPNPAADVHWGDSASYSVQVASVNNFAGVVRLTASSLPFGATAAPVNVNVPAGGSATATFNVATAQSATALGPDGFTLRGESPGASDRTRSLDVRVLPDEGAFAALSWRTTSSTCDSIEATVTGANITFDGPSFVRTQAHTHLRYAWTPGCRGAVVMGTSIGTNGGWPVSIFNFGFDRAIASGPGSRSNLGAAAWNHNHFRVSSDGSYLIAVAQTTSFHANLYNMLDLAQRPPMRGYSVAETISAAIVGDEIQVSPSGNSNDWVWNLP